MPEHELRDLLRRRACAPDVSVVDRQIRERFGARRAVMFSDMSGFSRLAQRYGVEHFLGLIHRMHELCLPVIEAHGRLVKAEADNLFATFDHPTSALSAAREMQRVTSLDASCRQPDHRVLLGIGVGWGDVLDLDGRDVFGHEVNLASRLGEDISSPGEILLTRAAHEVLGGPGESVVVHMSGVELWYWRLATG